MMEIASGVGHQFGRLRKGGVRRAAARRLVIPHLPHQRFQLGWRMRIPALMALLALPVIADNCRVLVDGIGCHTRQLAVARSFEKNPGVKDVAILPRAEAPTPNQRFLLIRSTHRSPSREQLMNALGNRAKYYRVISVVPNRVP